MRRVPALLLLVSLVACSEDPAETPDAGSIAQVDAGSESPADAGGKPDAGDHLVVGFAQLEGPAQRKVSTGASVEIGVQVYLEGVTDRDGPGDGIEVEIGYGAPGALPSTFTFSRAQYVGDADGLSPKANDRFTAELTLPAGDWDVAARVRCAACEPQELYVDLNWSQPDFDPADAIKVSVGEPTIGWCAVSPAQVSHQLGRGAADLFGEVYVEGLTEPDGAAEGIVGELGVGPVGTDPRDGTGWQWLASEFASQQGNNDQYKVSYQPTTAGTYAHAWRFVFGDQTVYCDVDGNDGSAGGFSLEQLGELLITEPFVDYAQLEGSASVEVGVGATLDVFGFVHAFGITNGEGPGAGVAVEFGYGAPGSDPANGWTWTAASYEKDVDGLAEGDLANDRFTTSLQLPPGTWDVAMRASLLNGPWVFVDRDGTSNGYDPAQAIEATVIEPEVGWCQLLGPATTTAQIGRIQPIDFTAKVWAQGLTDVTANAAPVGLEAEVGIGAAGSAPSTATGWSWSAANFLLDEVNDDVFAGSLTPAAIEGNYAAGFRFRVAGGDWFYCDLDGNDGTTGGFDPAQLATVTVAPAQVDYAQLVGPAQLDLQSGTFDVHVDVYAAGITEGAGPGAGIEVEVGAGLPDGDPTDIWQFGWVQAAYVSDVDGLSPGDQSNDRYLAQMVVSDGTYDVAARVRLHGGPWTYVDLDGTSNGYSPSNAMKITVGVAGVSWCALSGPSSGTIQLQRGSFPSQADVYVPNVTGNGGSSAITGEVGYGPVGTDPRTASWSWAAGAYLTENFSNDRYSASLAPPATGSYAFTWRFKHGSGDWIYCDTDGNDGQPGGFDPNLLGSLEVIEPRVDFAKIEGPQVRAIGSGEAATVNVLVFADGITTGAGQGANVSVEIGYGNRETDPATDASWRWSVASYKEDFDGLTPGDLANDRYEGIVTPPDGEHDLAARVKFWSGEWVYVDISGTLDGYESAYAARLIVGTPQAIAWTQLRPVSSVENVGGKLLVSGEVYAPGITDAVGQGAGITAEVGIGPAGTDPKTAADWSWSAASWLGDAPGSGVHANDVYGAWITAPAIGEYSVAMRFTMGGTTTWVDGDGWTPFSVAELATLETFAPGSDIGYCNIQLAGSGITVPAGSPFDVYAQLWIDGVTDASGEAVTSIQSQFAYGPDNSDPTVAEGWSWEDGSPNPGWNFGQNNDEHMATLTAPETAGTWRFAVRFRNGAGWTYCDADNANHGFEPIKLPTLTVQ